MNNQTYDKGIAMRTAVLGDSYVEKATGSDEFNKPMQDLVTEYCWGAVWGRDGLSPKTRSMLNIAMLAILNRPIEFQTHIRGAINNGVTREEIREILLQVAVYAGVPTANASFRIAGETLTGLDAADPHQ